MTTAATSSEPAGFAQRLQQTIEMLHRIAAEFAPASLASSLAAEDMVLTDLILSRQLAIRIFSLETGRLPPETLDLLQRVEAHYHTSIDLIRPNPEAVDTYVAAHGLNGFYDSVALRQACCQIRKVEPLGRALSGQRAWLTGQRRSQSATRRELAVQEHDAMHDMEKFNPLADWSEQDVWHYLRHHQVPYNALHDQGHPSIGCAPCTRAVQPGEDVRAGRWWWETADTKECGLHVVDGKLVRLK